MENYDDSNCTLTDFSLYDRYMRSFHPEDYLQDRVCLQEAAAEIPTDSEAPGLGVCVNTRAVFAESAIGTSSLCNNKNGTSVHLHIEYQEKNGLDQNDIAIGNVKPLSTTNSSSSSAFMGNDCELSENSSYNNDNSLQADKNDPNQLDLPVSSDDTKSNSSTHCKPTIITSFTMENSNNAVDSLRLFNQASTTSTSSVDELNTVFKLPIAELSFNGTIKHIKKLKPIVDPITALSSNNFMTQDDQDAPVQDHYLPNAENIETEPFLVNTKHKLSLEPIDNANTESSKSSVNKLQDEKFSDKTSDYSDSSNFERLMAYVDYDRSASVPNSGRWTEQSQSSLSASFDSAARSPDLFPEDGNEPVEDSMAEFRKKYEAMDKELLKKMEKTLQGVLPPPSVTTMYLDVPEMLEKYYSNLHLFTDEPALVKPQSQKTPCTPSTRLSMVPTNPFHLQCTPTDKIVSMESDMLIQETAGIQDKITQLEVKVNESTENDSHNKESNSNNVVPSSCNSENLSNNEVKESENGANSVDGSNVNQNSTNVGDSKIYLVNTQISSQNQIEEVDIKDLRQAGGNTTSSDALLSGPNDKPSSEDTVNEKLQKQEISTSNDSIKSEINKTDNLPEKNDVSEKKKIEYGLKKIEMCTENEAKETTWPEVLRCHYFDVWYNVSSLSERREAVWGRVCARLVPRETASSLTPAAPPPPPPRPAAHHRLCGAGGVGVGGGGGVSAGVGSPRRRLSHLARRRQVFATALQPHPLHQRLVLIDKNFFPHRKLAHGSRSRSPRGKRTPGKKTPRKTPTSSRKKALRRLNLDETGSRSQPTRETSRRALFTSPDERKSAQSCTAQGSLSLPRAMKSRRALFSPDKQTRSLDGVPGLGGGKRKWEGEGPAEGGRGKLQKSQSFGGGGHAEGAGAAAAAGAGAGAGAACSARLARRNTDVGARPRPRHELSDAHKQKLVWAVSEALRAHGWRMGTPGFREKASALATLTRRLLLRPPALAAPALAAPALHAAPALTTQHASTTDAMLKIARQYVFAIIQGRSPDECYQEEQVRLLNEASRLRALAPPPRARASASIKENACSQPPNPACKTASKNILQDKLLNVDSSSSSGSSFGAAFSEDSALMKSSSMPSFRDAARMRARRQISFDNIDEPPNR